MFQTAYWTIKFSKQHLSGMDILNATQQECKKYMGHSPGVHERPGMLGLPSKPGAQISQRRPW